MPESGMYAPPAKYAYLCATRYIASEDMRSQSVPYNYGTYAHELGNILDAGLNYGIRGEGGDYERTYRGPGQEDTGRAIEDCMFKNE